MSCEMCKGDYDCATRKDINGEPFLCDLCYELMRDLSGDKTPTIRNFHTVEPQPPHKNAEEIIAELLDVIKDRDRVIADFHQRETRLVEALLRKLGA